MREAELHVIVAERKQARDLRAAELKELVLRRDGDIEASPRRGRARALKATAVGGAR
jgi:hypothetical protein